MGPRNGEDAFIERLREDAGDGPRLIYADWLEENREPEHAELIRIECALAELPSYDPRRIELSARCTFLRERNESRWSEHVAPLVTAWEIRRGVLDSVALTLGQLHENLPKLVEFVPIRKVRLLEIDQQLEKLANCPSLRFVHELDLFGNPIGDDGAFELGRSRMLTKLTSLNLGLAELGDRALVAIALSPAFESLQSLFLNDNPGIGASGTRHLASIECLTSLRELDLSALGAGPSVFSPFFTADSKPTLRKVWLHANQLRDVGTAQLAESRLFAAMAEEGSIDLRRVGMGPRGAQSLASSPSLTNAHTLDLDGNSIGDAGLMSLATSPHTASLRYLSLRENRISDDGARSLLRSPLLGKLRLLDLTGNLVSQECVEQLLELSVRLDWRGLLEVRTDTKIRQRVNAPVAIRVEP